MINVCERESLGMGESWGKWELSELDEKSYQCIKEFIFETVEVGVKLIGTRVCYTRVTFKKKIYRPRITEIGGVGDGCTSLEVEYTILDFQ